MRLSFPKLDYYEVVFNQKVKTFIHCHVNAFRYFGGVPHVVKFDNLKAAVLEAHLYETIYQSLFKRFADYYGFNVLSCRVRKLQEEAKTKAGIKYVKYNFLLAENL